MHKYLFHIIWFLLISAPQKDSSKSFLSQKQTNDVKYSNDAKKRHAIDYLNHTNYNTIIENNAKYYILFKNNAQESKNLNYKLGEAESYSNLSLVSFYLGKYEDNLKYSLQAIDIFEQINDQGKLAREYGEMGFRMKTRNPQKAMYYMQKGMKIAEKFNLKEPLLSIYNNYGTIKKQQIQSDSAMYFFQKCLLIKESSNDSIGIPFSLNNIGEIYIDRKQFADAKKLFDRALKIRLKLNDKYGIADSFAYLGDLYFVQKKYNEALLNYDKSLQMSLKFRFNNLISHNYKMISECFELTNNSFKALNVYKKYTFHKDSILNRETNSRIAELEVRYETNEKEKLLLQNAIEAKNRNYIIFGLGLFSVFVAVIGFLLYRQQKLKIVQQEQAFELKNAIFQIDAQNNLQNQRLAISKDLHDNIGAQLTFIISAVETTKFLPEVENSKLGARLTKISDFAKDTIVELRDTIWAMNANEISFEDLKTRIYNFIEKAKDARNTINFSFEMDRQLEIVKLSSVQGMNIYRTIQEAINNALKHANPNNITIQVTKESNKIKITIIDDGTGFNATENSDGNGLGNMEKRIREIGGTFAIKSGQNGTVIEIHL